ncbi:GNAT family N-acetyltransferase [Fictibacillus sp. NRS-1165]|uniref:GNAT family N-acetyltransferase n=1 Tax=Fictibacillus sp. NRS-1165 TaxID=3144463 RepID=UPI003D1D138C
MIYELPREQYANIKKLFKEQKHHPVLQGVISGINRGKIFVDDVETPSTTLVWAFNEMFYLAGDCTNHAFNSCLQPFIADVIKSQALEVGEQDFNLEVYPSELWQDVIPSIFPVGLKVGERVPFKFHPEQFSSFRLNPLPEDYRVLRITPQLLFLDSQQIISKFWSSEEAFFLHGLGWAALHGNKIIGTCISVFACGDDLEIGIHVYDTSHRGKGLATCMAHGMITDCMTMGISPHWTTESFRYDSIVIAQKLGFERLPNYQVYYLPYNYF